MIEDKGTKLDYLVGTLFVETEVGGLIMLHNIDSVHASTTLPYELEIESMGFYKIDLKIKYQDNVLPSSEGRLYLF